MRRGAAQPSVAPDLCKRASPACKIKETHTFIIADDNLPRCPGLREPFSPTCRTMSRSAVIGVRMFSSRTRTIGKKVCVPFPLISCANLTEEAWLQDKKREGCMSSIYKLLAVGALLAGIPGFAAPPPACVCSKSVNAGGPAYIANCTCGTAQCVVASTQQTGVGAVSVVCTSSPVNPVNLPGPSNLHKSHMVQTPSNIDSE